MIIWIASYPRSGNTYYRMLLSRIYGLKTYSVYNDPVFYDLGASQAVGHEQLPAPIEELSADQAFYFVKTHDLPADDKPAIYLVRDGRDALVSFTNFLISFSKGRRGVSTRIKDVFYGGKFRHILRDLIVSSARYGGWSNNVMGWTGSRKKGDTFVIRYEDLIADPGLWLEKSMDHFGIKRLTSDVDGNIPDFRALHKEWPQFFRKGRTGSWREEMPKALHDLFWKHHAAVMNAFGYFRNKIDDDCGK